MAIIDIFKKDGQGAQKKTDESGKAKKAKNTEAKSDKKAIAPVSKNEARIDKKSVTDATILKSPQITEKAARMAEGNWYTFKVVETANKIEIARTVEGYYGVDVEAVNIVNIPSKRKRRGKGFAIKPGYKKAIVKVKEGQKIEILPR